MTESTWNPMSQQFDAPVTLAEFLRARLDEDAAAARGCDRGAWATVDWNSMPADQHGTRWDPARVLAEVEAKRRIVKMHGTDDAWCDYCSGHSVASSECPTIRLLALPYAGHSDYRPEWAL